MAGPHDDHTGLRAPGFAGATGWLNDSDSSPPSWSDGPTLVDFFTYSCVNCLRTLPHLARWHDVYGPRGLQVVGVHTPEFAFERDPANVARFLAEHGLRYPVALDAERRVWDRWANKFWPRKYLVDRRGVIRLDRIGEGGYASTERAIRSLLLDANPAAELPPAVETDEDDVPFGAVCVRPTAELFAGWYRGYPGNAGGWREDTAADYAEPAGLTEGALTLAGRWTVRDDRAAPAGVPASAAVRFLGYTANAVLRSADGRPVGVRVTLDGRALGEAERGSDARIVGGESRVEVVEGRLYQLVASPSFGPHTLRLLPDRPELELYSFTFRGCPGEPIEGT